MSGGTSKRAQTTLRRAIDGPGVLTGDEPAGSCAFS
jgi:hypothetical protein